MMARVARRLVWAIFVVWATVTLAFLVNHALPSDPARMVAGPQARPQDVERIRKQLGLDQSMYVQYARFMGRLVHVGPPDAEAKEHATCAPIVGRLHLDLGKSYQQRRPVVTILAERLPRTILLALAAAFVQVLLGVTAGVLAAARKKTVIDHLAVSAKPARDQRADVRHRALVPVALRASARRVAARRLGRHHARARRAA